MGDHRPDGWLTIAKDAKSLLKRQKGECRLSGVSHCGAAAKVPDAPTSKSATHDALETRARPDQSRTTPLSIHRLCRDRRYTFTNILIFPTIFPIIRTFSYLLLISTTHEIFPLTRIASSSRNNNRDICVYIDQIPPIYIYIYRCIFFFYALMRIRRLIEILLGFFFPPLRLEMV